MCTLTFELHFLRFIVNKFDNRDYQRLATNVIYKNSRSTMTMDQLTQMNVHELMRLMIERCMRDEQVNSILSQLFKKLVTTSVSTN